MSAFDIQYQRQGGRCFACGVLTLPCRMNRAHLVPRAHGGTIGDDWRGVVLMHATCNAEMKCLHAGSLRFTKWIRRVLNTGRTHRFIRREVFVHNPT